MTKLTGNKWVRVPYSGAAHIPGDVMCITKPFKMVIELKNREDVSLDRIFKTPNSIQPYMQENQVLMFNNHGQTLVVIPIEMILGYDMGSFHATVKISNEWYSIVDLKTFCDIIKED